MRQRRALQYRSSLASLQVAYGVNEQRGIAVQWPQTHFATACGFKAITVAGCQARKFGTTLELAE